MNKKLLLILVSLFIFASCDGTGTGSSNGGYDQSGQMSSEASLKTAKCLEERLGWLESGEVDFSLFTNAIRNGISNCDLTNKGVEAYIKEVRKVHPQFLNDFNL